METKEFIGKLNIVNENIIFEYQGYIDEDSLFDLITQSKESVNNFDLKREIRKTNFVITEMLHNVKKNQIEEYKSQSTIVISADKKHNLIFTSNIVPKNVIESLKSKIDPLNEISDKPDLLKAQTLRILRTGTTERGGASIGLIDMVRKSLNNLEYKFEDYKDNYAIFSLIATINIK